MAATLTLQSVTPNALKYLYNYNGADSMVADVTNAQLLVDAKTAGPGPSKLAALLAANASGALLNALMVSGDVSLILTPLVMSTAASTLSAVLSQAANALRVTGVGVGNGDAALIELRANVTPNR